MNPRVALHVLAAVAAAVSGGVVVFAGLSDAATQNLTAVASLVGIAINAYMAATTSGMTRGASSEEGTMGTRRP